MVGTLTAVVDVHAAPVPATCSVDVVSEDAAFAALEAEWNDVAERAAAGHPFARHEWFRTWWECFGNGCELSILVVRKGARITAIAPLLSDTTRMYGMPVRRLRLLQNDHSPRADFIVAEAADESYRAIWRTLAGARDRWDLLQLNQLPAGSPTRDRITALAEGDRCLTGLWRSDDAPYLTLTGTSDQYFAALTSKFRQNLRNRLSRLTKIGEPRLEVDGGRLDLAAALDDAFRLEASGWKDRDGTSICSDSAVHRFYTLLAERAFEHGWFRLLFLSVNGERIATSYGAQYANRLFLIKTGYNPEYAQCSPFKLLTYFAVQYACANGLAEIDFLGDSEPWKLEWTSTARPHDWLYVFADSARGRLLHSAKFRVTPALKRLRG